MTIPRRVFVGTFLITRRCFQRKLLLRPDEDLNNGLLYVILLGAKKFAVRIHGLMIMSNHYHLVCTPTKKNLPRFVHYINMLMAKVVNTHRGRVDAVWSPTAKTSVVHLADAQAVLKKLSYLTTNPVAAGLVAQPAQWPGVRTLPADVGTTLTARRPDFFRSEADAAAGECSGTGEAGERRRRHVKRGLAMPAEVEVLVEKPPLFEDASLEDFRRGFALQVETDVKEIHADRRARGLRTFLGRKRVLLQNPEWSPGTPECPDYKLDPAVASFDRWRKQELLETRGAFVEEYRKAWKAFRDGDRAVRFPEGTYGPCVLYGARCHGEPPEGCGLGSRDRDRDRRARRVAA